MFNVKIAAWDGHQWYTIKVMFDSDSTKMLKQYFIHTVSLTFSLKAFVQIG